MSWLSSQGTFVKKNGLAFAGRPWSKAGQLDGFDVGRSHKARAVEMFGGKCCSNKQKHTSNCDWSAWAELDRRQGCPSWAAAVRAAGAMHMCLGQGSVPSLTSWWGENKLQGQAVALRRVLLWLSSLCMPVCPCMRALCAPCSQAHVVSVRLYTLYTCVLLHHSVADCAVLTFQFVTGSGICCTSPSLGTTSGLFWAPFRVAQSSSMSCGVSWVVSLCRVSSKPWLQCQFAKEFSILSSRSSICYVSDKQPHG